MSHSSNEKSAQGPPTDPERNATPPPPFSEVERNVGPWTLQEPPKQYAEKDFASVGEKPIPNVSPMTAHVSFPTLSSNASFTSRFSDDFVPCIPQLKPKQ